MSITSLCDSTDDAISSPVALTRRKGVRVDECKEDGGEKTKVREFDSISATATTKETRHTPSSFTLPLSLGPTGVLDHHLHHCQESHPAPPATTGPCFPDLLRLTTEDLDAVSLIEAETCPEYLTESTSETQSLKSSPRSEWTDPPAAALPLDRLELVQLQEPTRPLLRRSRPSSHGAISLPQSLHREKQIPRAKSDSARPAESRWVTFHLFDALFEPLLVIIG